MSRINKGGGIGERRVSLRVGASSIIFAPGWKFDTVTERAD